MKKTIAYIAIFAFALSATPALAFGNPWGNGGGGSTSSSDISVNTSNSATVTNTVTTKASSGDNTSNGGDSMSETSSSEGGWSQFSNSKKGWNWNNNNNNTRAESHARGGNGGSIATGEAIATTEIENYVNTTETDIEDSCGCEENGNPFFGRRSSSRSIDVDNDNTANVSNTVETKARSGDNTSNGGNAHGHTTGRDGYNDSTAGSGGTITTGRADSFSSVVNVINSNVTRIRR